MNISSNNKLDQLSLTELEALLQQKRLSEQKHREQQRQAYEAHRDQLVNNLVSKAKQLQAQLAQFRAEAFEQVVAFYHQSKTEGSVRNTNKGNATFKNTDQNAGVRFSTYRRMDYDERADAGCDLIRDFLADTVRKKDRQVYDLLVSLLEKDRRGRFSPANIQKLYKHENRFADPRWVKALQLFRESYVETNSCRYIDFLERDPQGRWQEVSLSFSKL